jgi:hypothetical protein
LAGRWRGRAAWAGRCGVAALAALAGRVLTCTSLIFPSERRGAALPGRYFPEPTSGATREDNAVSGEGEAGGTP